MAGLLGARAAVLGTRAIQGRGLHQRVEEAVFLVAHIGPARAFAWTAIRSSCGDIPPSEPKGMP